MSHNNKCHECGYNNLNTAKFCSQCGHDLLSSRKQNSKKTQAKTSISKYSFLFVIGILILLFIFIGYNEKQTPKRGKSRIPTMGRDFLLERKVIEVASKFTCSCGSCGEESLETCVCAKAEEERNFIRHELNSGKSVSQAILSVEARYGYLKSEFVGKIDGSQLDLNFPGQQENDNSSQKSESNYNKIASMEEREEVLSHFACPCGQCDKHELRDCNCQHPAGATEVKLFVDMEIKNGKHTVNELINLVDQKYRHKIR